MNFSNVSTGLFLFFLAFSPIHSVQGCDPLPTFLYPANEVYWGNGWPIPVIPDDAIAIVGDEYLSKAVYKEWLFKKIGFDPVYQKRFMMTKTIKQQLHDQGVDTEHEKKLILQNLFDFEIRKKIVLSSAEWIEESKRNERFGTSEPASFRADAEKRFKDSYLIVLYILRHWDDLYAEVFEKFGVAASSLDVAGDDAALNHIIRLNNAYLLSQRYAMPLDAYLVKTIPFQGDLLHQYNKEYVDWVYDRYQTPYLTENFVGVYLAHKHGKENNIHVSEKSINELYELRLSKYTEMVEAFNRSLPASSIPMVVSPVYKEYIRAEALEDLLKSKIIRLKTPLKPHEVVKMFYDEFGYAGQRCEVLEIFKWVRIRRDSGVLPGYADYAENQETMIRNELTALREKILAEGSESFPVYAMAYNQNQAHQLTCGLVDVKVWLGEDYVTTLDDVALHEISSVRKTPLNTLSLFWLAEKTENSRTFYTISKTLPSVDGFDFEAYDQDVNAARNELERLKALIENGASMKELAESHSDSFNRHGVDISSSYQNRYGFAFAKDLAEIPEGELAIISSNEGLHLVKIVSRQVTPFSDETKKQLVRQYDEGLASPFDRYKLTEQFLYAVHPYFQTN